MLLLFWLENSPVPVPCSFFFWNKISSRVSEIKTHNWATKELSNSRVAESYSSISSLLGKHKARHVQLCLLSLGLKLLCVSSFLQQTDSMHADSYCSSNDMRGFTRRWKPGHVLETWERADNRKWAGVVIVKTSYKKCRATCSELLLNMRVKKTVSGTVREHKGADKSSVPEYVGSMRV